MVDLPPVMLARFLRSLLLLLLPLTCTGCLAPVAGVYPARAEQTPKVIHLISNGWHTSLVLQTSDLDANLQQRWSAFLQYPYLDMGWGDEGFYRAEKVTTGLILQAAFYSRGSVVHLRGLYTDPLTYFSDYEVNVYRIELSPEGHARLQTFLSQTMQADPVSNQAIDAGAGQDLDSRFVAGQGRYSLVHTCNHWTADALRSAGLPITPVYSFSAGNVEFQIKHRLAATQSNLLVLHQR